jgi:hypothetical protein
MPRRSEPKTAQDRIARCIAWCERNNFQNIAADLREALAMLSQLIEAEP